MYSVALSCVFVDPAYEISCIMNSGGWLPVEVFPYFLIRTQSDNCRVIINAELPERKSLRR